MVSQISKGPFLTSHINHIFFFVVVVVVVVVVEKTHYFHLSICHVIHHDSRILIIHSINVLFEHSTTAFVVIGASVIPPNH